MLIRKQYSAEILEDRLIVWDPKEGTEIYKLGFYGKPVGVPKPKTMNFDSPLILDLIEGLYLLEKGVIKVYKRENGVKEVTKDEFIEIAKKAHDRFLEKYLVYRDLREKGFVVTPGIKFGSTYAIYERGPGIDHSPFLVSVMLNEEKVDATDIVRAGRLATTVRKRFIVAIPDLKEGKVRYLMFKWWRG